MISVIDNNSDLPPDILDCITGHFQTVPASEYKHAKSQDESNTWDPNYTDEESKKTLQNLCLVSRSWREAAAKRLFCRVQLASKNKKNMLARLGRLWEVISADASNPGLRNLTPRPATLIRYFAIKPGYWSEEDPTSQSPVSTRKTEAINAFFNHSQLLALLDALLKDECNVRGFMFAYEISNLAEWTTDISPSLRSAIRRFIRSPKLEVLTITHVNNLPLYLFNGSSIKHLTLICYMMKWGQITMTPATDAEELEDGKILTLLPAPKLEYLCTDQGFDFGMAPGWVEALRYVKRVVGWVINENLKSSNANLFTCSSWDSLQDLKLEFMHPSSTPTNCLINFGRLPSLETLTIGNSCHNFCTDQFNPDNDMWLEDTRRMLDSGDPCRNLKELEFTFLILPTVNRWEKDFLIPSPGHRGSWESLGDVIASSRYPSLVQFTLKITIPLARGTLPFPVSGFDEMIRSCTGEHFKHAFRNVENKAGCNFTWDLNFVD